jgi:hypothetical protein
LPGYPAADVDVTGDDGRPDVTVRAPSGLIDLAGAPVKIPWIVVEAKDEIGCFKQLDSREEIFIEKAKYIGTNTGWFVMADPSVIVARHVGGRQAWDDIVVDLDGLLSPGEEGALPDFDFASLDAHASVRSFQKADP